MLIVSLQYIFFTACRLPSKEQENGPFFSGTEGILNLSKARMSDSGNYSCIGTNTFGSTSESTTIIIIQGKEGELEKI